MEVQAKCIRKISFIQQTILGNACYSQKEMDAQINKAEKIGNLDDRELKLLQNSWELRRKLANDLIIDLEGICNETEI